MRWDPQQYVRYADERGRPFHELLARVVLDAPARVVDVGCGPGTLTATLAERWPAATITGLDSSPEMIDRARPLTTDRLDFRVADAGEPTLPGDVDLLVSNATLQWVPDHLELLRRWAGALRPGSWLAFQVPGNFAAPSHRLMREIAHSPQWRQRLDGVLRHEDSVAEPDAYAWLLSDAGLAADVWETTYLHVLPGDDPVLEWVTGTGLRPVLAALGDDADAFVAQYRDELRVAYPRDEHGTLFPFRRIFAVAHRDAP